MNEKKRLLIINDEPDMLSQMRRWLSDAGYVVESTLSGKEGVKLAKEKLFDLILLDYNLKKEQGGEKTARVFIPLLVKANPLTPIIVVTATVRNVSAGELGVSDVLIVDRLFWKKLLNSVKEILKN